MNETHQTREDKLARLDRENEEASQFSIEATRRARLFVGEPAPPSKWRTGYDGDALDAADRAEDERRARTRA